jgi:ketosteroid isomerase-like protein
MHIADMNRTTLILLSLLFVGCQGVPDAETAVRRALEEQKDAWNRGDIRGFMGHYLNEDGLTFIGSSGLRRGHDTVLNSYLEKYDTPEKMGRLDFEILEFKSLSKNTALLTGRWVLERKNDRPSGYFSLIWVYTDSGWKIIHDHTS